MAQLDINVRGVPGESGVAVAELAGAIDGSTVDSFQDYLEEILKKGIKKLLVDLSGVPYVNSTGLGSLVKYQDRFKSTGGGLALMRVTPKVKIIMETLGLHATLNICKDKDAALKALNQGTPPPAAAAASSTSGRSSSSGRHSSSRRRRTGGAIPTAKAASVATASKPAPSSSPPAAGGLPHQVDCESCGLLIEMASHGNFRCPRCGTLVQFRPDGQVRFMARKEAGPAQLTLTSNRECAEGLILFVGAVCRGLFNGSSIEGVRNAMKEMLTVLMTRVYPNDQTSTYHVSVEKSGNEVEVKMADHGRPIDLTQIDKLFARTQQAAAEFEVMPHPKGGNIIRCKFRS